MSSKRFVKPEWHQRNYEFFRKQPCFQRGEFVGSYLEIVDEGFDETPPMYKHVKGGQLIGVNDSPEIIYGLTKRTKRTLICGDAFDVAYDLCKSTDLPQVGVYVMDTQTSAGNQFWETVAKERLLEVVQLTRIRYKNKMNQPLGCGLVLNFVLDGHHKDQVELAQQHASSLGTFLQKLVPSGKVPNLTGALPEQLADISFVGMWGPHQVYRSATWRMITTRLWIQGSTIVLEK